MVAPHPSAHNATLERASRRFEYWRKARPHVSRIPDALWSLAVEAAREQGVNPTARCLHLGFNDLKRRLKASSAAAIRKSRDSKFPPHRPAQRRQRSATFVELAPPLMAPTAVAPCTIELENTQGAKMRIHLASPESLDVVALSRSLWGRKP